MGSVTKTFAVFDTPFWRADGLSGQAASDTGPVRVTFDGSPRSGRPGVLLGFVDGDDARALNQLGDRDRARAEVESYVRYFGPKAANPTMTFDYPWDNDRLAGGAPIGFTPPGVLLRFGEALRRPVGPIHWSGSETATVWNGYMDGRCSRASALPGRCSQRCRLARGRPAVGVGRLWSAGCGRPAVVWPASIRAPRAAP